jgi:hypothetical protein
MRVYIPIEQTESDRMPVYVVCSVCVAGPGTDTSTSIYGTVQRRERDGKWTPRLAIFIPVPAASVIAVFSARLI